MRFSTVFLAAASLASLALAAPAPTLSADRTLARRFKGVNGTIAAEFCAQNPTDSICADLSVTASHSHSKRGHDSGITVSAVAVEFCEKNPHEAICASIQETQVETQHGSGYSGYSKKGHHGGDESITASEISIAFCSEHPRESICASIQETNIDEHKNFAKRGHYGHGGGYHYGGYHHHHGHGY